MLQSTDTGAELGPQPGTRGLEDPEGPLNLPHLYAGTHSCKNKKHNGQYQVKKWPI